MSDDDDPTKVQLVGMPSGKSGKLIKWSIILILTGMTGGTFLILYLGWKYVKLCVLFYFKTLYFIIRMPIWLFIQLPLHYLGVGMHKTSQSLKDAYGVINSNRKRYGFLFGLLTLFMVYNFLPRNTDAVISFLTDATLILPLLGLIPFAITFFIAWLSAHANSPNIARKDMPGGLNTGMKERTATAGAAAAAVGHQGLKGYNSIEGDNINDKMDNAKEAAGLAKNKASEARNIAGEAAEGEGLAAAEGETILAGDMVATLEGMPLIGSLMGGAGEAAGMAGTAVGASGGTILIAIAALLVGFIIINAILAALTYWIAGIVIPMIIGPIIGPVLGALGLGQAYGNWFGSEVANNVMPQVDLTAEKRMVEQAGAKIGCALKGPACLRQWRANNTARPGSEDVGEKYRLEIDSFSAGGQGGVDIAYKRPQYRVPVSFLLLNTRQGLKGIDARKVKWRVRIGDADRSGDKSYCSTDWKKISESIGRSEGTILPGTSFSPQLSSLDNLTLQECEMLQPALGHDYTAELDVKYKYSSQSTLQVRAMTRQNMRDEDITPAFKKSETADTPVETYINVKEPVTYVVPEDGGTPRTIPFTVKVGTNTDRYDVEYRVHPDEFKVYDSSQTKEKDGGRCLGLDQDQGDIFGLSVRAESRMNDRVNPEDTTTWFDASKDPSAARCTFELERAGTISPTGETLNMRVDANYTVVIEETSEPFEVRNTRCTEPKLNCPILFYAKANEFTQMIEDTEELPPEQWLYENHPDYKPQLTDNYKAYQNATCTGIDAGSGCTAVEKYNESQYPSKTSIDSRKLAVEWNEDTAQAGSWDGNNNDPTPIFSCSLRNGEGDFSAEAIGISTSNLDKVRNDPVYVLEQDGDDLTVEEYRQEFSVDALSSVPDWIADAEYSRTKEAVGCKDGYPKYEVSCSDIDAGGISGGVIGGALYLATNGDSCGSEG